MYHLLRTKKLLLLALTFIMACGAARGIEPSDWPYLNEDNPAYGSSVVYFYDDEFRNGGVSAHVWKRTTDESGATADTPYAEWANRPAMTMTGYQYEDDNGVKHPIYRLSLAWMINYNKITPTHLLFVQGKNNNTPDYEYNFGRIYSFGHEAGYGGEEIDYSRISEMTEGKHTVYLASRSDYSGPNKEDYNWEGHYDADWNLVYPKVHVWGTAGDLTQFAQNESMTRASDPNLREGYIKYCNGYSHFFEYTFYYFGGDPTNLLFRLTYDKVRNYYNEEGEYVTDTKSLNYITGDLRFEEGAVYHYDGQGVVTEPDPSPDFLSSLPKYERTIYFADTDNWITEGDANTYFIQYLINGAKDATYGVYGDINPTFRKYIKINEKWCRVYLITVKQLDYYDDNIKTLALRYAEHKKRSTPSMELEDGQLYYYCGNGIPAPEIADFESKFVDEKPEEEPRPVTIYVNLGANQLMEEDLWEPPYCHPYKREPGRDFQLDDTYKLLIPNPVEDESQRTEEEKAQLERERMTQIAPGFYSYTIEDANQIDDVVLYYYAEDKAVVSYEYKDILDENGDHVLDQWGNWEYEVIPIYNTFPGVFVLSASRSPHFDPTELTKYVFDIGIDCIHQSYLTYEQLEAIKAVPLDKQPSLWLTGNETVDEDKSGDDPILAKAIENDHGCFFTDFEVGEGAPAVYKFSTVDVAGAYDALGRGRERYDYQRGWASYNLGIIGCHIDPERADYEEWYKVHVVRPEGSPSRMVSININQCMDYNGYCQYPWRVEYDPTGETGVKFPGHYWFVVDFNEDDQTVVLLDFDPHPHLFSVPDRIRRVDIPDATVAETLHAGNFAEACGYNGKIMHEKVNVASGVIEVQGTGNQAILDAGFDVKYTVFTENGNILYAGKPEEIVSDYMDLSEHTGLAVQGRFHYQYYDELLGTDVDKYFRTRYSAGEVDLSLLDLSAPQIDHTRKRLCLYMSGEDEKEITVGGVVNFTYSVGNGDSYVYQPDYKMISAVVDGNSIDDVSAPLLHKGHWINNHVNPWGNWLGYDAENPWQPHDGVSEPVSENHWGNYIVNSPVGNMPVLFHRLAVTDDMNLRKCHVECAVNFTANYPFLAHRQGKIIEVQPLAAAKADAGNESVPADVENYKMVTVSMHTPYNVDFGNEIVTGVDDVAVDSDAADSEPVYHNLSGIRVDAGNLTPGIYLETRGSVTRKIVIR